jgi:hypothetical protein
LLHGRAGSCILTVRSLCGMCQVCTFSFNMCHVPTAILWHCPSIPVMKTSLRWKLEACGTWLYCSVPNMTAVLPKQQYVLLHGISCVHSGECEDDSLLGYSAVWSRSRLTFLRCVLPPSSGQSVAYLPDDGGSTHR